MYGMHTSMNIKVTHSYMDLRQKTKTLRFSYGRHGEATYLGIGCGGDQWSVSID